ncbi:MAG: RND efflux transporter [Rhodospirillaceae bacterium]|nr:MAG: RND efflux transporter [Rhodospirillaceae bacterium]
MELSDAVTRVADSRAEMTMTLIDGSGGQRVRTLVMLTKLKEGGSDNRRRLNFTGPADIKGTATLLIENSDADDDMWIFLPTVKKVRRLVADNKRDSFVGSDLTFGDIIGHKPADWTHALMREDTVEGRAVWVIESLPKDEAIKERTGYGRRVSWIDRETFVPLKLEFWDESGAPLKTSTTGKVVAVEGAPGKWQFLHVEAHHLRTGHRTILDFDSYRANVGLGDAVFTPRTLEREP